MKNLTHIKYLYALAFGLGILSSCTNYHVQKGDLYYDNIAYAKAIHHYEKVYPAKSESETALRLADSYYKTGNIDSAEAIYKREIASGNRNPKVNYQYAKVLMADGKHDKAEVYLKKYLQVHSTDPVAKMLLSSCRSLSERYRDTSLFALHPIIKEDFVNTFSVIEYQNGAVFAADKTVFLGTKKSAWTGNSYLDLYFMKKDTEGNWLQPELLQGDINGRFHEGPACFSSDGKTVYFTRSNYYKRKLEVSDTRENNLKIFKATLIDDKWKNLVEFPYNSDDYSVGHPTTTADGKTMYFVSDMPGGYGGTDLYKSSMENGMWSEPVNLGPVINTAGNEMFPYIHTDGALYFSSDAHNSMGGLDVFITYFDGSKWAQPENLNYPLNSNKDDFGFSLSSDNRSGFVSSSRSKSDKIYSFEKFDPTFNLYGVAREKGTQIMIEGVKVEIFNVDKGTTETVMSDPNGKFNIRLAPNSDYNLICTKFGCFTKKDFLSTKNLKYSQDFFADFEVEPIILNKPIVLENIYYDFDKWNIREDAAVELNKLVKLLNDNPTIEIEMGSHTDSRGNDMYNLILSDKRALAAVKYLISQGIDPKRLTFKGYGEKVLRNECGNDVECSEEKHQLNRRTEFKVTKM